MLRPLGRHIAAPGLEGFPFHKNNEVPMRSTLLAAVAAFAFSATTALAADERNVTVVNATGYGIKFLGFNPPDDDEWNDNEISSVLGNGASVYVKFNGADKGCDWNIRVDWDGYDSGVLWRHVDLCKIEVITLHYNKDTKVTSFTAK